MKPKIALTLGDPAGIGPEITARICFDQEVRDKVDLFVVGRRFPLSAGAMACGLAEPDVELIEVGEGGRIEPGQPGLHSGKLAGAFIEKALDLCQSGRVHAMVTCPISKEYLQKAGYPDTGHTTMLTRLTGAKSPVMMLAGERLKVVLVTVHKALSQVPGLISQEGVCRVTVTTARDFARYFGKSGPRIAVAGLNPHAGEEGLFGDEEKTVIAPAVAEMAARGLKVTGPLPPDTVFWRAAQGEFDLVVAMYHDQGLIPLKLLHFEDAVNVTLGLPIIRTSVDHGTAYDIAGQGKANPASLKAAVLMAADMAVNSGAVS